MRECQESSINYGRQGDMRYFPWSHKEIRWYVCKLGIYGVEM